MGRIAVRHFYVHAASNTSEPEETVMVQIFAVAFLGALYYAFFKESKAHMPTYSSCSPISSTYAVCDITIGLLAVCKP